MYSKIISLTRCLPELDEQGHLSFEDLEETFATRAAAMRRAKQLAGRDARFVARGEGQYRTLAYVGAAGTVYVLE